MVPTIEIKPSLITNQAVWDKYEAPYNLRRRKE